MPQQQHVAAHLISLFYQRHAALGAVARFVADHFEVHGTVVGRIFTAAVFVVLAVHGRMLVLFHALCFFV